MVDIETFKGHFQTLLGGIRIAKICQPVQEICDAVWWSSWKKNAIAIYRNQVKCKNTDFIVLTTSFKPSVDSRTSSMVHALCFNHTCPNLQQNSHIHWSIQIFTNIYHNIINLSTFERDFQALSDDMYLEDPSSGLGGILTPTFHKCALSSIRSDLHHYPLPYRQCTHIRKAFPNAFRRSTHLQDPPSGWKDMVCVTITLKEDGQWYLWEPS